IINPSVQDLDCRDYFFAAICARRRSSCFRSSGVNSAPKSSASNTWRISTSVPPPNGARLSHSIASAFDFTCHSQNPAISSLVSANGPSITVRFVPSKRTRTPFELGWSPSPASITPAFTSSSLNLPMSVRIFLSGRAPASESLFALTITMNRIVLSPSDLEGFSPRSTITTNEGRRNRHAVLEMSSRRKLRAADQLGCLDRFRKLGERRRGSLPTKLIHGIEQRRIDSQRCEFLE